MPERTITSEQELRDLYGHPGERAVAKERPVLNADCRAFIAHAPFLVMGTAGADGRCDVSPKGDAPGFVHVLDERHLAIPDRLGNNRLDGLRNILENDHVGLIFFIPGREDTLRVNGRARIARDEALLDRLAVNGKRPVTALVVEVEQAFMHCARAFKRAGLWEPARWPDAADVRSMQRMIWDLLPVKPPGQTVEEYERDSNQRLQTLY
ncbi:MAG: pyridoxamine 5'-phosphate oxidase family protein [Candidatus Rokuibacteriota bacterium]|nr:MAG: pyridoxamine 5'-phosphate oxidase family protein [Candidatus Rokubacteria bacterium]